MSISLKKISSQNRPHKTRISCGTLPFVDKQTKMAAMDDSFDDEFVQIVDLYLDLPTQPRPRVFRDRSDPMIEFNEEEFRMRFRLAKFSFMNLLTSLSDELQHAERLISLPPIYQLLISLRFYSSGSFQVIYPL